VLQGPPAYEVLLLELAEHLLQLPELDSYEADMEHLTEQQQVVNTLKRVLPRYWWAYVQAAAVAGLAPASDCNAEGALLWLCLVGCWQAHHQLMVLCCNACHA
jgi:hypothetical protein